MPKKKYLNLGRERVVGFYIMMFGIDFMAFFTYLLYLEHHLTHQVLYNNFTIYISMISLGFAVFIYGVSFTSNVNTALLTNDRFSEILNDFENDRIALFQDAHYRQDLSRLITVCWKCRRYMERAVELTQATKIQPYIQEGLYQQIEQLIFMSDIPWNNRGIRDKEINNAIKICENALFFNLEQEQKEKLWYNITYLEIWNPTVWELAGFFFDSCGY